MKLLRRLLAWFGRLRTRNNKLEHVNGRSGPDKWSRPAESPPHMMSGVAKRRFRIFILGAGFSQPAGLPLGPELWAEILRRATGSVGRSRKFERDLNDYIAYRRECDGIALTPQQVDFEDFLAYLDVEHYLGLRGSDTWSADGNEGQVVVKTLIGQILAERTPTEDAIPPLYLRFASALQPFDYVMTFNYDVLLERALEAVGKPFRLFPARHRTDAGSSHILDLDTEEVIVLKLHGSIDWFDRTQFRQLEQEVRRRGLPGAPRHPVFGHEGDLRVVPVIDGPGYEGDPLSEMYRVQNLEDLYAKELLFHATPWLLSPSTAKILYAEKLREFWYGMGGAGAMNFGLAIIGYSLPPGDRYAHQILYQIVKNYQTLSWGDEVLGQRKTPLVIVNRCDSPDAQADFHRRYAFVDWSRAKTILSGFDDTAVRDFEE